MYPLDKKKLGLHAFKILQRFEVLTKLREGDIDLSQASSMLSITDDYVRRLFRKFSENGIDGLIFRQRGGARPRKKKDNVS